MLPGASRGLAQTAVSLVGQGPLECRALSRVCFSLAAPPTPFGFAAVPVLALHPGQELDVDLPGEAPGWLRAGGANKCNEGPQWVGGLAQLGSQGRLPRGKDVMGAECQSRGSRGSPVENFAGTFWTPRCGL